jgi:hypothetical protein
VIALPSDPRGVGNSNPNYPAGWIFGGNNSGLIPSTPAEAAPYQTTPWEPTVSPSDPDYADEQQAAQEYTSVYGGSPSTTAPTDSGPKLAASYSLPNLGLSYDVAPDLVPTKPPGGGSSQQPPINASVIIETAPHIYIDLGQLLNCEQICLNQTSLAVAAYDTLQSAVTNATTSDSLFGQNVGSQTHLKVAGQPKSTWPLWTYYDDLDKEGIAFAQAIIPQMEYLAQQVGQFIEVMGCYCAALNNTGQMYAYTDKSSAFLPSTGMPTPAAPPLPGGSAS